MLCIVIWIRTGDGFEKETKRILMNWRFLEERVTAHVRNTPRHQRIMAKRTGNVTRVGALDMRGHLLWVIL